MLRIRSEVLAMQPYSPGKPIEETQREFGLSQVIKLASNENPLGPSPKAVEAIRSAVGQLHLYPDAAGYNLRHALAKKFSVPPDQILLGNGSDELLHYLGLIMLEGRQDEIVVGHPSFVRYEAAARLAGSKIIRVPLTADLRHDLPAMAAAITESTRMVFIANPNNPTGTIVTRTEFEDFLESIPRSVMVVMDEAYAEFAAHEPSYPTSLDYLDTGRVVGLRTFSKAYGLAGIRVGYGWSSYDVADAINRARQPFDVNSLAQVAAIAALEDENFLTRTLEENRHSLSRIESAFRAVGLSCTPSYANFVCADLRQPAEPIFRALLEKGVIVRSGHVLGMPNHLRVSAGTRAESEQFAAALYAVMATAGAR